MYFCRVDNFTGKTIEKKDSRFEEANILYNIGALHSYLGAVDRRADSDVGGKVPLSEVCAATLLHNIFSVAQSSMHALPVCSVRFRKIAHRVSANADVRSLVRCSNILHHTDDGTFDVIVFDLHDDTNIKLSK